MRIAGLAGSILLLISTAASASPPDRSLRPEVRPNALSLAASKKPQVRYKERILPDPAAFSADDNARFQLWINAFRDRARAAGIRGDILDQAFAGVKYDADAIRRDRSQSEFTKAIWDYLDSAVSPTRIRNGQAALARHDTTLRAIERRYGVEKEIVAAIWGLESAYGSFRGSSDVIASMATLAFDGRRGAFFEGQLLAALKILQSGDVTARNMTGSWAGAMGHTQFMPTSYLEYAVDFTGDNKRDIWSDDPSDALASTASYLKSFGWTKGQPWGVEVVLPKGFDYALADRAIQKSPDTWGRLGVTGTDGRTVKNHGPASILLPAGGRGPALMIFDNFSVLERYNTADAYVIGVGHLADRLGGDPGFKASWPREDRVLSFNERKEMQRRLTLEGFSTQGVDGRIGPRTINAVRAYQQANGLLPDGYPSLRLLNRLR
ncbi:MAG: lytic murein transglycosylase [Marinibacterium sp.]